MFRGNNRKCLAARSLDDENSFTIATGMQNEPEVGERDYK